ncbi:hypothetical protein TRIUR3_27819 [Triticum urartu]|uniref:Uncharacterized protein n=1 Tax=Triticum urartu TaxID=4572 RepID=M7ZV65_TRIUA|nr:hypothetical protein TRIUR3_27819 [Triticum urartu]
MNPKDFRRCTFSERRRSRRRQGAYGDFVNLKMICRLSLSEVLIGVGYQLMEQLDQEAQSRAHLEEELVKERQANALLQEQLRKKNEDEAAYKQQIATLMQRNQAEEKKRKSDVAKLQDEIRKLTGVLKARHEEDKLSWERIQGVLKAWDDRKAAREASTSSGVYDILDYFLVYFTDKGPSKKNAGAGVKTSRTGGNSHDLQLAAWFPLMEFGGGNPSLIQKELTSTKNLSDLDVQKLHPKPLPAKKKSYEAHVTCVCTNQKLM